MQLFNIIFVQPWYVIDCHYYCSVCFFCKHCLPIVIILSILNFGIFFLLNSTSPYKPNTSFSFRDKFYHMCTSCSSCRNVVEEGKENINQCVNTVEFMIFHFTIFVYCVCFLKLVRNRILLLVVTCSQSICNTQHLSFLCMSVLCLYTKLTPL